MFYDITAQGDCTGVTGAVRSALIYSLWTFSEDPTFLHLDNSIYWAAARDSADGFGQNGLVCMNIEPDTVSPSSWQRAVNTLDVLNPTPPGLPHTDADVILTQQIINERLEEVSDIAVASGAELWNYRTLQVNSMSMVYQELEYPDWLAETIKIVTLDNGAHANLIRRTGGGILYEFYVPEAWNASTAFSQNRLITVMERICDAYDALGLRSMPLIYPFTVGVTVKNPVLMDLFVPVLAQMRKRYAGRIGTWAADHVGDPTNYAPTPAAWKAMLEG